MYWLAKKRGYRFVGQTVSLNKSSSPELLVSVINTEETKVCRVQSLKNVLSATDASLRVRDMIKNACVRIFK